MRTVRGFVGVGCVLLLTAAAGAAEKNWAERMFSQEKQDFGLVARASDVRHRIEVKNPYAETVHILKVDTTCGCTAGTPSTKTIRTHEKAYVEVVMNTWKFQGHKNSNVDVTLQYEGGQPVTVRIPIHAEIRQDIVVNPGLINFGTVASGEESVKRIAVKLARPGLKLTEARVGKGFLKTEISERSRSAGEAVYEVAVKIDPNAPQGQIADRVWLMTNDRQAPYVPVAVNAVVEPDIVVATPTVSVGQLTPGAKKTHRVVLRGLKPFQIEEVRAESGADMFDVAVPSEPKKVHVLSLDVKAPNRPGQFSEEFVVNVAGRDEPLRFKANGTILAGETGGTLTNIVETEE
jgi:hypothetical protein